MDTVSIAAPNHWHALAAIWAMQAGKHVYVEKPVSHNVSEGRHIVQVAEKTGRLCQAGTQIRSDGALAAAVEYIRSGKLGDVTLARSIIYGDRGRIGPRGMYEVPRQVDYNLFMGPAADVPLTRPTLHYDWHWDWNTGNGELGNNNIHYIDICRWMMGLKGLGDSVLSVGGRLGYEDAGETPNTQMVVHTFGPATIVQEVRGLKTDPLARSSCRACHPRHGRLHRRVVPVRPGWEVRPQVRRRQGEPLRELHQGGAGRWREDLNADILEGHQSTALCHVGNISYRLGQPEAPEAIAGRLESYGLHEDVPKTFARMAGHLRDNGVDLDRTRLSIGPLLRIDPGSEVFSDHREANALLTREYRRPFVVPAEREV